MKKQGLFTFAVIATMTSGVFNGVMPATDSPKIIKYLLSIPEE